MPTLFRDYETFSTLDIKKFGAWRYATHPTTGVWCCAYAIDDGPVQLWVPGNPVPAEWIEAAGNPDWLVSAFNDNFERLIEQHIMGPRCGWPTVPVERHRCSQAAALALALPASLKDVAEALQLPQQKADSSVMRKMAKPRKPRRDEDPKGVYWDDNAENREQLYAYCKQDVETERALHHRIPSLTPDEQALWVLDTVINDRGIHIDSKLIDGAMELAKKSQQEILAEFQQLTNSAVETVNQRDKLIGWLSEQGCEVTDAAKETVRRALTRKNLPPVARRALELRLEGAHNAAAKLLTMRKWLNADSRVRGAFRFHGAHTGRWTSFGIQLQNMKKPITEDLDAAIEVITSGDINRLRRQYPQQPMSVIGDITRATIAAAPGHRFIAADFSGVESRIVAWVSGQQSKLDQWAKFDRTGDPEDEPYLILGLNDMKLPREHARATGKTADLAFSYMGGVGAWQKMAPPGDTTDEATVKKYQQAWRNAHPHTVRFWRRLNSAAVKAVRFPSTAVPCGRVNFEYDGTFLFMHLPSGRRLAYPFPRLFTNDRGDCVVIFKSNQHGKLVDNNHGHGAYAGIWLENVVQAVARDVFAAAMPRLEAAGYPVILHVHDEIVSEVPNGFGSTDEFLRIMLELPAWADGLPLNAKVRNGPRFCKTGNGASPDPVDHVMMQPAAANSTPDPEIPVQKDLPWVSAPTLAPTEMTMPPDIITTYDEPIEESEYRGRGGNGYASGEREWGRPLTEYIYKTAGGAPYLKVKRTSAKQFPQYHLVDGRWVKGTPAGPKIPYRLPELLAATPDTPVWICEGEKDAESVAALGLVATTNSGGAGKWTPDLNIWFVGKRTVYLLEDNDDAGRKHVAKIADELRSIVPTIRVISFPELPEKGDVSDWIQQHGGTREQLLERAKTAKTPQPHKGYTLIRASDIAPRAMDWVWPGHLLRGTLELTTGLPGLGKSQVQCQYVACATTGRVWPDGTNGVPAGNVIMLTAEDCLDQILIPRLQAAKADLNRVHILRKIRKDSKDRMFLLGEDIEVLAKAIIDVGDMRLVTIDPLTAYMGGKLDSHKVTDVRSQLGPLAELAERADVAFSCITHPSKNAGQRAIDHFIGSQAFIAAARIGHLCVPETEENASGQRQPSGRVLFANPKNNPHPQMPTLSYRITQVPCGVDQTTGADITAACVVWEEAVDLTADEAVAAAAPPKRDKGSVVEFLLDILAGGPALKSLIDERAAKHGFSADQLDRAKKKMGIMSYKEKGQFDGHWYWALPQHAPQGATDEDPTPR